MNIAEAFRNWRANQRWIYFRKLYWNSNCFITCTGKEDGAGAQAQAVLSVLLFSRATRVNYVHTPLANIDHNETGRNDWDEAWEQFFNFGFGEESAHELRSMGVPVERIKSPYEVRNANVLYEIPHCYQTWHAASDYLPDLLDELRTRFLRGKADEAPERDIVRIALHARRGDVKPQGLHAKRFTPTRKIENVYENLSGLLEEIAVPYEAVLHSQGDPRDFQALKERGVAIETSNDPFETFSSLVRADIILTAKSSYSYLAALLSRGVVLYEPFWHRPLDRWLVVKETGAFDKRQFVKEFKEVTKCSAIKAKM